MVSVNQLAFRLLLWICGIWLVQSQAQAAKPVIVITQAQWSGQSLTVAGRARGTGPLVGLYDGSGRYLGQAPVNGRQRFFFTLSEPERPDLLCSVRAQTAEARATARVKGRPKSCSAAPVCRILTPTSSVHAAVDTDVTFKGKATLKDRKAGPLRMEWDFGGGSLGEAADLPMQVAHRRPATATTTLRFGRDSGRYRVRLTAWDQKNRYCEDSVEVVVGTPPDTDSGFQAVAETVRNLAQAAQGSRPHTAANLGGAARDKVVLPYEDRSMQCTSDTRVLPDAELPYPVGANSIKAYVFQKALQPVALGSDKVSLRYSAASNPSDPAGHDSLNSTSRNWPIDAAAPDALLQKGELFDRYLRPPGTDLGDFYRSWSLMEFMNCGLGNCEGPALVPDEGPIAAALEPPVNVDHGRYMPGFEAPYLDNRPQAFGEFNPGDSRFSAVWLPLTDIDDLGQVNPTPVFRVEALDPDGQTPLAATDVTLTAGRDFHCRECHAYGKIGANPDVKRTGNSGQAAVMWMENPGRTLPDQEYDALMNMTMLHAFYDDQMIGMTSMMEQMEGTIYDDGPVGCGGAASCHSEPKAQDLLQGVLGSLTDPNSAGSMSNAIHRLHGRLQYNDDKTDILRDETGRYLCGGYNHFNTDCAFDPARSLFPVKAPATGAILPMEQNCLRCHSGEREQCYRDRMYTAGVTCYQCHGDMQAVANLHPKPEPGRDGNAYRLEWLEQPDCGSCHTGSGNRGGSGEPGYFSAGVKILAFAEDDPSATPNRIDRANPDERRFAVTPVAALPQQPIAGYNPVLQSALYRLGQDRHGQVACPACHGAAHAVWPNRNPNHNDNLTALELQGHTGTLLECNVCHTAESFANLDDLDEGLKVPDPKTGVLGGPHNLHPVNDPYWWKSAAGDVPNGDGSTSGGWHNDMAKQPGAAGEDQCAACHGNDHKGTRLSKTPVDRVFDFRDSVDLKQLRKAGIKPRVTVKAGTPIGCDTCHSIELSCTGSFNASCGQPSNQVAGPINHPPSINPPHGFDAVIGQDLNVTLSATDSDGDAFSFDVAGALQGVSVDGDGHLTVTGDALQQWAYNHSGFAPEGEFPRPPFSDEIRLIVADERGNYTVQPFTLTLTCPSDLIWDNTESRCKAIGFTAWLSSVGIDRGSVWSYPVPAVSATGRKLSFAVVDPVPPGMSINGSGVITFDTHNTPPDGYSASVAVTDDMGNRSDFSIYATVCQPPMHYTEIPSYGFACAGAVRITSSPDYGVSRNGVYTYQIAATQADGKPVSYTLLDRPDGMTLSETGLIRWDATGHDGEQAYFRVEVNDGLGSYFRQEMTVTVCGGETPVWAPQSMSHGCDVGPIRFRSRPANWVSANSAYSYLIKTRNTRGLPVNYALENAPVGMQIDANGLLTWNTTGSAGQVVEFAIVATDAQDGWAKLAVPLNVCPLETPVYDPAQGICVAQ